MTPQTSTRDTEAPVLSTATQAPADPAAKQTRRSIRGGAKSLSLSYPEATQPVEWSWPYVIGIVGLHLMLPLAFIPWLFSWSGVALALAGLYVFGTLGINLCYHRILTHQSLVVPKWLERTFATLGICCLQDTPARWVATHRLHHRDSDEQPDPHTPLVNFLWGHCGWLMVKNRGINNMDTYDRYARDVLRDPYYFALERNVMWLVVYALHAVAFYLVGSAIGWAMTGSLMGGVQLGLSWVVWGVIVRTVAVWHITWSVNSVTHLWGYRNYDTGENSRNNWFVGIVSNGEGWHNNHHADQRAAAHGHKWWEFDVTWLTVRALSMFGLAREIVLPKAWSSDKR